MLPRLCLIVCLGTLGGCSDDSSDSTTLISSDDGGRRDFSVTRGRPDFGMAPEADSSVSRRDPDGRIINPPMDGGAEDPDAHVGDPDAANPVVDPDQGVIEPDARVVEDPDMGGDDLPPDPRIKHPQIRRWQHIIHPQPERRGVRRIELIDFDF